ncbi:copper amine oxidase [Microdochium bolleyi]|uniref:Amine oxidase n=1 Tax=Microdochium bolleyi TaxID=196109 RepID=A0A136IJR8_9PEZI|nr:copper amine oxidase [Microdochium bolleyi]
MQFANLFLASLVSGVALSNPLQRQSLVARGVAQNGSETFCSYEQPTTVGPYKNIWQGLTEKETVDVIQFLHSDAVGLNLTAAANASDWDNAILSVELMLPNKTEVLQYIDGNATASPVRHARAILMFGATENPYVREYMVGPLPICNTSTVSPYTFRTTRGGDGKVTVRNADQSKYVELSASILREAEDVTKFLWNLTAADKIQLPLAFMAPITVTGDEVSQWQSFIAPTTSIYDTVTLLPLGLYVRTDITGRDPSKWQTTGWLYNNIFYPTLDDLRTAIKDPKFEKLAGTSDQEWAHSNSHGEPLKFDEMPPPTIINQGPPRFAVDAKEEYVEWMDFSFYISSTHQKGLRLYDVRYKGKRILYELGLDEAIAHYAGIDPVQSGTIYFDGGNGFGPTIVSLVRGYDCPGHATFLNTTQTTKETSYTQSDGVCLFEMDKGYPIQRHGWAGYTGATKNIGFTVRAVYTIGNYDYMTSYEFSLDGSIEVSVRASGYISAAYYANNEDYGFKIHDSLSGSLHDHVITFKADLDVLGTENSVQKIEIVPSTEKYVWLNGTRNTMKARKSFIATEDDGKINWSPNGGSMYAVVNKDQPNSNGEYPGYRIAPATGVAYLTVQDSNITRNAGHQSTHHLYVTKHKDSEDACTHQYNSVDIEDPPIDFSKYFDGESLDQEDLVVWFNLGMHHMPHTGDLPNTVFTTAHSAVIISPFNYLRGDPSRASKQQVEIALSENNPATVKTWGAQAATCSSINQGQVNPDLTTYSGGITVQKYPFDYTVPDREL